jgi:hypothetical protein
MSLCQYKYALGVPGKGVHRHVGGVAIMDVLGTLLVAAIATVVFENDDDEQTRMTRFYRNALALFLLGIVLHWLFCVPTAFARVLSTSTSSPPCVDNACHNNDTGDDKQTGK